MTQGIFPVDFRGGFRHCKSWGDPFFKILWEPAKWIASAMNQFVNRFAKGSKVTLLDNVDKLFSCCFRSVLELFNKFGPVIPVPVHFQHTMKRFYDLMVLENDVFGGEMQSNIPMFVSLILFWYAHGQIYCEEGLQPDCFENEERFPEAFLEQKKQKYKNYLRLHMRPVLGRLASNGTHKAFEEEASKPPCLYDMFKPRFSFGVMPVKRPKHKVPHYLNDNLTEKARKTMSAYDEDCNKCYHLDLCQLATHMVAHTKIDIRAYSWLDEDLERFDINSWFYGLYQTGGKKFPGICNTTRDQKPSHSRALAIACGFQFEVNEWESTLKAEEDAAQR